MKLIEGNEVWGVTWSFSFFLRAPLNPFHGLSINQQTSTIAHLTRGWVAHPGEGLSGAQQTPWDIKIISLALICPSLSFFHHVYLIGL